MFKLKTSEHLIRVIKRCANFLKFKHSLTGSKLLPAIWQNSEGMNLRILPNFKNIAECSER